LRISVSHFLHAASCETAAGGAAPGIARKPPREQRATVARRTSQDEYPRNILWVFLGGGIILFLEYLIAGAILCITIIGIPFGIQVFKLSLLALLPFGRRVTETHSAGGCLSTLMNILWFIFGGIALTLTHAVFALLCAITIIGIPSPSST